MKTTTIKTTLLSLIIFSSTFSAKAQKEYQIGLTDTANIALFLVDFHNYELIKADFVNLPCTACKKSGRLLNISGLDGGSNYSQINFAYENVISLAEYKYSPIINYDLSDSDFRLFPYLSHPINEEAFTYRIDSTHYNSLLNNIYVDWDYTSPKSLIEESEARRKQRLDSAWAMISSSRIARKFINRSNYHLTFKYIRYDGNPTNLVRKHPTYERWFVMLLWTDGPVSINNAQENPQIQVFPNPLNQQFTIKAGKLRLASLALYNSQGQLLKQLSTDEQSGTIPVNTQNLSQGVYFLKFQLEDGSSGSHKLIKL